MFWNAALSIGIALILYGIKKNDSELGRQNILINKTREDVARDYLTRHEHFVEYQRLIDKIDKLDAKIDKIINNH